MNTLAVIAFSALAVGVLIVAGMLVMRDRRSYKDDSQWPHGKDITP